MISSHHYHLDVQKLFISQIISVPFSFLVDVSKSFRNVRLKLTSQDQDCIYHQGDPQKLGNLGQKYPQGTIPEVWEAADVQTI